MPVFHGITAVAELKRNHRQGRCDRQDGVFHGITAVAELKPFGTIRLEPSRNVFHGITAVAELKLVKGGTLGDAILFSTASPPWPN